MFLCVDVERDFSPSSDTVAHHQYLTDKISPLVAKNLGDESARRFGDIVRTLFRNGTPGYSHEGTVLPKSNPLNEEERTELKSFLKETDTSHLVRWEFVKLPGVESIGRTDFTIFNFPVDPIASVKKAIDYHKERMESNGVTHISYGRLEESEEVAVYVEVDESHDMEDPYEDWGSLCGLPFMVRLPRTLEGFTITQNLSNIKVIEPIS